MLGSADIRNSFWTPSVMNLSKTQSSKTEKTFYVIKDFGDVTSVKFYKTFEFW